MPHGFDAYRVFVSAPGDLEADRQATYDAIAHANEAVAMPAKILLVNVGLRDNDQIANYRSAVSDNVRWSTFFVQLFQDDWGPGDRFRKLFLLALECRGDASMPMRDLVIGLKDAPGETNPEILAFRRELEERSDVRVFRYAASGQLREHLDVVCAEWARSLMALEAPAPGVS
jgi:hypothetical protein